MLCSPNSALLKRSFRRNETPNAPGICKFVQEVRETGMLLVNIRGTRTHRVRTDENVPAVAESVRLNPGTLTSHRSQ